MAWVEQLVFNERGLGADFYVGVSDTRKPISTDQMTRPFALGGLFPLEDGTFWGLDIASEGIRLESTYGRTNVPYPAVSGNLLLGTTLSEGEDTRILGGILLGARGVSASCPASYLGYQCYADREPDIGYGFNYGALIMLDFGGFSLGLRSTNVSQQAVLGLQL